jgi:hypothetical protein
MIALCQGTLQLVLAFPNTNRKLETTAGLQKMVETLPSQGWSREGTRSFSCQESA